VLNLIIDETISETLENDNMGLQNMSAVRMRCVAAPHNRAGCSC
jgi:hypothetical protein